MSLLLFFFSVSLSTGCKRTFLVFIFESSAWYFNSLPSLLGLGEWMWKRQTGHRSHICHNLFDKAQKHAVAPVFLENTCYLCVDTNYIYNLWFLEVVTAPFFFFYCRFLISHRLMCSQTLPNIPLKSVSTSDARFSKPSHLHFACPNGSESLEQAQTFLTSQDIQ